MVDAVIPGGLVLDLQVIRPDPVVEVGREVLCEIDGSALFESADAAAAAIDALIGRGRPRRAQALSGRHRSDRRLRRQETAAAAGGAATPARAHAALCRTGAVPAAAAEGQRGMRRRISSAATATCPAK